MINLDIFLVGIMITSTLTGLTTEAVKKIMTEYNRSYHANTLAGVVSLIISAAVGACYIAMTGTAITSQVVVYNVALCFLSWLGAMVGYDKVIQSIGQIKTDKGVK